MAFIALRFLSPFWASNSFPVNLHHMHQQPPAAPRGPKSSSKSVHLSNVSVWNFQEFSCSWSGLTVFTPSPGGCVIAVGLSLRNSGSLTCTEHFDKAQSKLRSICTCRSSPVQVSRTGPSGHRDGKRGDSFRPGLHEIYLFLPGINCPSQPWGGDGSHSTLCTSITGASTVSPSLVLNH